MARRSRDASPARKSRSSPKDDRRSATERDRPAQQGGQSGLSREDQEDRERRAFHARIRARDHD